MMESFSIYDNGTISGSFPTIKGLCFYGFFTAYFKWITEDMARVPQSEHNQIEEFFADALSFLINIQNDENDQSNFTSFDIQLKTIIETIDALKD